MNTILSFIRRHPITAFAVLAYLLSWWTVPFIGGAILSWGVALSAWIMLAITAGKPGLSAWVRRLTNWRAAWYWYLVGPGIIAFYMTLAFAINILLGATVTHFPQLLNASTFLMLLLVGGQWEEPGWTGYALPALEKRFANRPHGALLAALTLAVLRAAWHLPLVLSGSVAWFDMIFLSLALQLIIAWLFHRTGSVPVVIVFHFASNLLGSAFGASFEGQQGTNYYALFVALALLIALGILWKSGLKLGQKEPSGTPASLSQKAI